jgi:anthranilate phosphoribosyltransferase
MKKPFLRQLISGTIPPERSEFHAFFDRVMNNDVSKSEIVAFLAGISAKPLATENVENFLSYYFKFTPVKPLKGAEGSVNIVGTGGGSVSTFNISTAAAFVASAAGAKVLKSGSMAYSSQCGSLDVLSALGVPMQLSESQLSDMIGEFGLGFIPASHYSPLLKQLVIKALPIPFRDIAGFINLIGPLLCPYHVSGQLIGIGHLDHFDVFRYVLTQSIGVSQKTLLVHAESGMDELCSIGKNLCHLISADNQRFTLSSTDLGFRGDHLVNLAGGSVSENVTILRDVLSGGRRDEARDTVILNSAALLFLAGISSSIHDGIQLAGLTIDKGNAISQLERVVEWGSQLDGISCLDKAVDSI